MARVELTKTHFSDCFLVILPLGNNSYNKQKKKTPNFIVADDD